MFVCVCICLRVQLVGLDAVGKSTLLSKLRLGDIAATMPTIGFTVETVQHRNITITTWDLGGGDRIRTLWRQYFRGAKAAIFVMDCSDHHRSQEASDELAKVLAEEELRDAPLLVMANKQDLRHALTADEVIESLALRTLPPGRRWHVQGCCARRGQGLEAGMRWLADALLRPERTAPQN